MPKLSNSDVQTSRSRRRAQQALWRLSAWGTAAALALVAVAFASQTETGTQRLQMAFGGAEASNSMARAAAAERRADEAQAQVRQLAAEVHKLAAEREHLDARLAGIERDFNDLTGALGAKAWRTAKPAQTVSLAQTNFALPSLPGGVSALAPWPDQTPQPNTAPAAESSAPRPVRTIAVTRPLKTQAPAPAASEPPSAQAALSAPKQVAIAGPAPAAYAPPKLKTPPRTVIVPPLPTAIIKPAPQVSTKVSVPMPPVRVAAISQNQPAALPKREYGLEIGGASSTARLRRRWTEIKANFGPQVAGLRPLIAHDRHTHHLPYRLVIGPLPSIAVVRELCVQFGLTHGRCHPTQFVGDPLARR